MRNSALIALLLLATAGATASSIVSAYSWFKADAVAEVERRSLPAYAANALKHAYAASETYSLMRQVGVSRSVALQTVYRLGQLNEVAEFYGRRPGKRDPTREIYKDLYNNLVGVVAAAVLEGGGRSTSSDRLRFLGELTETGTVFPSFLDPRVPEFVNGHEPSLSELSTAMMTFKRGREEMTDSLFRNVGRHSVGRSPV